jgi:hypothetical protein
MYEGNSQALTTALTSASVTVFNDNTINKILSLVTSTTDSTIVFDSVTIAKNDIVNIPSGTEVMFLTGSDTELTTVSVTGNAPVLLFQGAGGVNATIGGPNPAATSNSSAATADADAIQRVVVGTAGADTITIVDGKSTQIVAGDKDIIKAGAGNTVVVAAQGSSTVIGGSDTIVTAVGKESDFTVSVANGVAKIANVSTNVSVNMTGVNYVKLDNSDALIFAGSVQQAAVANLFQAILGRTADAKGLEYWFNQSDKGVSLKSIAQGFMASTEYTGASQTNAQFVNTLYQELLGRNADSAGNTFWLDKLSEGVSRADVAVAFASAAVTTAGEVTVVGTVTVIDGYGA